MKIKCIKEHSMKQEAKKRAIITGSGRGIGKETAITLAKKVSKRSCLF
jgi:NADP-dependent 3-hydroxy acid dehydrogenase YdfG